MSSAAQLWAWQDENKSALCPVLWFKWAVHGHLDFVDIHDYVIGDEQHRKIYKIMQKNLSRSVNISTKNAKKLFIIWLDKCFGRNDGGGGIMKIAKDH